MSLGLHMCRKFPGCAIPRAFADGASAQAIRTPLKIENVGNHVPINSLRVGAGVASTISRTWLGLE